MTTIEIKYNGKINFIFSYPSHQHLYLFYFLTGTDWKQIALCAIVQQHRSLFMQIIKGWKINYNMCVLKILRKIIIQFLYWSCVNYKTTNDWLVICKSVKIWKLFTKTKWVPQPVSALAWLVTIYWCEISVLDARDKKIVRGIIFAHVGKEESWVSDSLLHIVKTPPRAEEKKLDANIQRAKSRQAPSTRDPHFSLYQNVGSWKRGAKCHTSVVKVLHQNLFASHLKTIWFFCELTKNRFKLFQLLKCVTIFMQN